MAAAAEMATPLAMERAARSSTEMQAVLRELEGTRPKAAAALRAAAHAVKLVEAFLQAGRAAAATGAATGAAPGLRRHGLRRRGTARAPEATAEELQQAVTVLLGACQHWQAVSCAVEGQHADGKGDGGGGGASDAETARAAHDELLQALLQLARLLKTLPPWTAQTHLRDVARRVPREELRQACTQVSLLMTHAVSLWGVGPLLSSAERAKMTAWVQHAVRMAQHVSAAGGTVFTLLRALEGMA